MRKLFKRQHGARPKAIDTITPGTWIKIVIVGTAFWGGIAYLIFSRLSPHQ
jgi:hypothetical protein